MTSERDRSGEKRRKAEEEEEEIHVPRGGRLRRRGGRGRRSEEEDEEVIKRGKGMKRAKQISHSSLSEFVDVTANVPAIFLNSPFSFLSNQISAL